MATSGSGRLLIVKDDIFIIDFDGDPRLPLAERRRKAPAARDVAGLIRSIDLFGRRPRSTARCEVAPDEQGRLAAALDRMARPRGRRRSWPPIARP